jgi:hypothetical protein
MLIAAAAVLAIGAGAVGYYVYYVRCCGPPPAPSPTPLPPLRQ